MRHASGSRSPTRQRAPSFARCRTRQNPNRTSRHLLLVRIGKEAIAIERRRLPRRDLLAGELTAPLVALLLGGVMPKRERDVFVAPAADHIDVHVHAGDIGHFLIEKSSEP